VEERTAGACNGLLQPAHRHWKKETPERLMYASISQYSLATLAYHWDEVCRT
jgi:hypothetical protein